MTVREIFIISAVAISVGLAVLTFFWPSLAILWIVVIPLIVLGVHDLFQRKHTLRRIYPIFGRLRYVFENVRPEIQQYFVETNTGGEPISREFRELVYQRAKQQTDTRPFGSQFDAYRPGYEWVNHSLNPKMHTLEDPRVHFGGDDCKLPYEASPLNISAMSYGALSKHAILALNKGAKIDNFAHNTGEGGLSPYHLQFGGDLIWQIGTGYFGCRDKDGKFDSGLFAEKATQPSIKMIEIKLSQGAKPGHGGILPAAKLTQEIAEIRHVPMGQDVLSPPAHTAFSTPVGLLEFVVKLRELSTGKPVGFKLCIGRKTEFLSICKAMIETGILPDFITIDGAEGGTGAAPVEYTNSVGTPLREGLNFAHNALCGVGVRDKIRIIAAGKIFSAFHLLRVLALGADTGNSARGMMLALGCIQARHCNLDICPTGIATQNPHRYKALDVEDKAQRIANYHHAFIRTLTELLGTLGVEKTSDVRLEDINRRMGGPVVKTYAELYPRIPESCLVSNEALPDDWKRDWGQARADVWR